MKTRKQNNRAPGFLRAAGIRPTRQRTVLAALLFDGCDKHLTAEQVHAAVRRKKNHVSLATVYNTLHQFTKAGLLRQVVVDANRVYFDTNVTAHHHFFDATTGQLHDVPAHAVQVSRLPKPPPGRKLERVDVIIRLGPRGKQGA